VYFGLPVFVKGWEGTIKTQNHTLNNFFPQDDCGLVSIGGQSGNCFFPYSYTSFYRLAYQDGRSLVFQYHSNYVGETPHVWVKYTNPEYEEEVEDETTPPEEGDGGEIEGNPSPSIPEIDDGDDGGGIVVDPITPPFEDGDDTPGTD
jgi:hypothetical protein